MVPMACAVGLYSFVRILTVYGDRALRRDTTELVFGPDLVFTAVFLLHQSH